MHSLLEARDIGVNNLTGCPKLLRNDSLLTSGLYDLYIPQIYPFSISSVINLMQTTAITYVANRQGIQSGFLIRTLQLFLQNATDQHLLRTCLTILSISWPLDWEDLRRNL